ncbi:MAG: hypothetical protein H7Z13_07610 [Ferruginibacter sp.]|nr:hypothetical protein [Ferruginibacter sp.]
MSKRILVIYFTQSGQLGDILENFSSPLVKAGNIVEKIAVKPLIPYPFPWTSKSFFAQMPDSVLGVPTTLQPFQLKENSYDLVILGYQAWFLSPSVPVNSILHHPSVKAVLKNTPVITITGARNMWISAMEDIKKILHKTETRLVGNIVLVDRHHNFVSFVTTLYWMFTAKKDRFLNLFPKPGIADTDIANTRQFGNTVEKYLQTGNWDGFQHDMVQQKAVVVKYNLMFIESKAKRIFGLWANFIVKRKKRTAWLVVFKYYLLIALFIAAPILLTIDAIFFKPFLRGRIKNRKLYYSAVK